MKNVLFIVVLLFSPLIKFSKPMNVWKDDNADLWDYSDLDNYEKIRCSFLDASENGCKEDRPASLSELMVKRNPNQSNAASTLAAFQEITGGNGKAIVPFYHSTHSTPCSCGMKTKLLDLSKLGHNYYPRFLQTGVCKPEGCGGLHRCMEKHYTVKVLRSKERDPLDVDKVDTSLPEMLRLSWQFESFSVVVACECSLKSS